MHRFLPFLALICLALSLSPTAAQDGTTTWEEADAAQIRAVIESQLQAFQRDDGAEAFSHASPGIQRAFGTVETFMAMVRSGYSVVYRPADYQFKALLNDRGTPVQVMLFVGQDGVVKIARYYMERQASGEWKIDGVLLLDAPGESV